MNRRVAARMIPANIPLDQAPRQKVASQGRLVVVLKALPNQVVAPPRRPLPVRNLEAKMKKVKAVRQKHLLVKLVPMSRRSLTRKGEYIFFVDTVAMLLLYTTLTKVFCWQTVVNLVRRVDLNQPVGRKAGLHLVVALRASQMRKGEYHFSTLSRY